jgi:tRNA nucleotidyltransferase (CCA-adding enzyme)
VLYPDLAATCGSPQDQIHHPEGDVFTHTMHVADAAARFAAREGMDDESRAVLVFAAITHDLAKPQTLARRWETAAGSPGGAPPEGSGWERDGETPGQWRRERLSNHGHEEAGEPLAAAFLESLGAPKAIIDRVRPLIRCHLRHMALVRQLDAITAAQGEDVTARQRILHRGVRRLAVELEPATLEELRWLVAADNTGRGDLSEKDPMAPILEEARRIGAGSGRPEPVIKARDLIAAGIATPGPALGALHRRLYQAQLDGEIATPEEALAWARTRAA